MSRFPKELPKATSEPWWQSVSLADLDASASVIERFIQDSQEAPAVSRADFAKAMALQMLCVNDAIFDHVIDEADASSERYRPELHPQGDSKIQNAFGKWLNRAEEIGEGLLDCTTLLPEAMREQKGEALLAFLRRVEDHVAAHIEFLFHRRPVPFHPRRRKSTGAS